MLTTPVHFSTASASLGSKRAKQYPGNSGQSIFFLRSFQRLHFAIVGRNASMRFVSSCSRTTCSCLERVQTANQLSNSVSAARRRAVLLLRLAEAPLVRAFQLVVLPLDDRLRAEPLEELVVLLTAF